jgi:hypothetical protein
MGEARSEEVEGVLRVVFTAMTHKAEMVKRGERYRIAECPRCGGSLRLAVLPPKNHITMFCRGNPTDAEDQPHCGMSLKE